METQTLTVSKPLKGHDLFLVTLQNQQTYDTEYSRKDTRNTSLNISVFDPSTGQSSWVFEGKDQLITDTKIFFASQLGPDGEPQPIAHTLFVTFVNTDTNGDKRLSNSDVKSLRAYKIQSGETKAVLNGLEEDPRIWELKDGSHAIFFKRNDQKMTVVYDPNNMTVGAVSTLTGP